MTDSQPFYFHGQRFGRIEDALAAGGRKPELLSAEALAASHAAQAAAQAELKRKHDERIAAEAAAKQHVKDVREGNRQADIEAKQRHAEAVAYVATYSGTWGLPLDVRADDRWGTKYLKLTDRQVDALIAGKARDAERTATTERHPRYAEAVAVIDAAIARGTLSDFMQSMHSKRANLSDRMVEALLRTTPVASRQSAPETRSATISDGLYELSGVVYKVQAAVAQGSGQLYAKRLVVEGAEAHFEYAPGAIRRLDGARRLTAEEAGKYGKLYGFCIRCGRTLTDEYSIENGIGKVCAGRM